MKKFFLFIIVSIISVLGFSQVQRTSVLEQFTTENCPNCPPVLTAIENHLAVNSNFIIMAHHSGYYTDWLTIPENTAQLEFYNDGGSTYAPAGMVDRFYNGMDNDNYGGAEPGPVFWDRSPYGVDKIDERTGVPAFVTVNVNGERILNTYHITVSGKFLADFSQEIGVSLWLTEDHISTENQAGVSGTWIHRFTVRDAISDRLGDPITETTNDGDTYSKEYSIDIGETWDLNEYYIVAFVNNIDDGNVNNREIHNAIQVKFTDLVPLSIKKTNDLINVYPTIPNKTLTITNSQNSRIKIFNILGRVVLSKEIVNNTQTIDISNLKNGSYFVKIFKNNVIKTKKIVISR